ncbi:MAG: ATP-dependent helicase [Alphaproteobacteria bacterium]
MTDPFDLSDDAPDGFAAGPARLPAAEPPYLTGLNPAQRAAVEATDGPVLVLSGAGTGKTRVLTTRLVHLLATNRCWPRQILAVTFTNKAAREMRERVAAMIGGLTEGMWLGTFHALGVRILRRHAEVVGLQSNFTILDTDDQLRLLKQVMQAEGIDSGRWPARALLGVLQRWKDRGITPDKVTAAEDTDFAGGRAKQVYAVYQERLATLNAADFGDLLLHNLTVFREKPEVLADWQRRFRYILVDEYQDTNVAQYLWLRLLAQGHRNICCVGDDDQSIYGWRGAEVGNILRFEQDFPGATVIRLEQNYRSTAPILAAASGLIANNKGRLGKTLWTAAEGGAPIAVRSLWDGDEEARFVGDEVEALHRRGEKLGSMAILVRAGFQTRAFEERFVTLGVPYRVVGGLRFYERQEVRDAMAYLRAVLQPDDDLAVERIINLPRRGIGNATLQAVHMLARAQRISFCEAARRVVETDELRPQARRALSAFLLDLDRWRVASGGLPPVELTETVLDESGYTQMWKQDRSPEAPGRLENLKELARAIGGFETLAAFLEHVALVTELEGDNAVDQISLMTLHAAKGLEFDTVFLPGWEEGLFPNQRAMDESGMAGLEEERRLAYVGITRARRRVTITSAANRRVHNMWQSGLPSRFIGELPADHVEQAAEAGLFSGAAPAAMAEPVADWSRGGPGFQRWKAASGGMAGGRGGPGRGPVIDGDAWELRPREASAAFGVGDRVFHQKFGYGSVERADADRLEIAFDSAGRKTVIASFVQPADAV